MKQSTRRRLIITILVLVALCIFIWWYTKPADITGQTKRKGSGGGGGATPVVIVHPQLKDMPVTIQEVGSVEAEQSVNVISQVGGTLKKINFQEGQIVKAGDLLFEIDPSVYAADVTQAEANLQRDQALLDLDKSTANRYANLVKLEYVTRLTYDQALAAVKEQEAVVAGDQALLEQKKTLLSYTQIRAPITGKAGAISVHVGDLIPANGSTPLVVINRLENVLVDFNIAQDRLHDVLTYQRAGTLKLQVLDESGSSLLAQGELYFVGNAVSAQTGTIQMKGKVENSSLALWPGELVTVKLILTTEHNAMVIPTMAVQMGQKGSYVYVVRNNKAVIQPISVSRVADSETVVTKGLQQNDDIIGEIPPTLQEGMSVKITGGGGNSAVPTNTPGHAPAKKKKV